MAEVTIRRVEEEEIPALSALATAIVREHFDPLVGKAQNDYMLARFQTPEAIGGQIAQGYRYHWVEADGEAAGFMAWYPRGDHMVLSKFYLLKEQRGKGYAHPMLEALLADVRREGLRRIELNTFRGNGETIAVYERLGFHKLREEKNDIGQGFLMDDYVLEYVLA